MGISMSTTPQPLWQRAIGVIIGTAIGGIIYGIFLQALLVQSLFIDRKPLDPAEWREKLCGRAWIVGFLTFLSLILVPLRFLTKGDESVIYVPNEAGVAWFQLVCIFFVQIATVVYAFMRPELNKVEHPSDVFSYVFVPHRLRTCCRNRRNVLVNGDTSAKPLFVLSYSLTLWKNWVQILIILMEFAQLLSLSLDGGTALRSANVKLLSPTMFEFMTFLKAFVWQFGIPEPNASSSFSTGFGLLAGFSGFYIFLCGVFIALDLTVDSPLSPLLFVLLAGGFYGTITSGLLRLIFYSPVPTHVIIGSLMLAYYSSTAVFVSIYRSDVKKSAPGEIRIIPTFTAVERLSKGILAAIFVALSQSPSALRTSLTFGFCLFFAIYTLWIQPYSVYGVTLIRACCMVVAAWTALITFLAGCEIQAGEALSALVILGWVLIPIGFLISNKYYRCAVAAPSAVAAPAQISSRQIVIIENALRNEVETNI